MQKTRKQDLVIGIITVALGVFLWTYTPGFSDHTKAFCRFVLALFIGLGAILCAISIIKAKKPSGKEVKAAEFKNPLLMFCILVVYVILMTTLGFFVASALFMVATMLFMGYRKWIPIVCVTAGMLGFVWWLFSYTLMVRLPEGLLF